MSGMVSYRQSRQCYLLKNCADNPTGPITKLSSKLGEGKLDRSYLLCGYKPSSLTQGHDERHFVVFYYTPKHASWMNQVEIWLSILVRKLLKRGNFTSLDDLRDKILAFIAYYNSTMAKPIKWTYTGIKEAA
jgi:hypothetical protein